MKNKLLLLSAIIYSGVIYCQVGINTPNPIGTFHIDGAKDNAATGLPTILQQQNDVIFTSTGNLGVGTTTPANKVEINSGITNESGLTFRNLTATSPISAGSELGVSTDGKVINVAAPISISGLVAKEAPTPYTNTASLLNFTLPEKGTYLISYVGNMYCTNGGLAAMFLSTDPNLANTVPNSEISIVSSNQGAAQISGTGIYIETVNAAKTYYLGYKTTGAAAACSTKDRNKVVFAKIAP